MQMPDDYDHFGYSRKQIRFTGLACDGKPITGFLDYTDEFGYRTIEKGKFTDNKQLTGVGKRIKAGLYEAIGEFEKGMLCGEAIKEYEREDLQKFNGFGTYKNEVFNTNNE